MKIKFSVHYFKEVWTCQLAWTSNFNLKSFSEFFKFLRILSRFRCLHNYKMAFVRFNMVLASTILTQRRWTTVAHGQFLVKLSYRVAFKDFFRRELLVCHKLISFGAQNLLRLVFARFPWRLLLGSLGDRRYFNNRLFSYWWLVIFEGYFFDSVYQALIHVEALGKCIDDIPEIFALFI